MLSLLHHARLHIKKLDHQKAQEVKERLCCEQQNLHQHLEELQAHLNMEKAEAVSLDSSRFSSEHSDSEEEVDVEGLASASIEDVRLLSVLSRSTAIPMSATSGYGQKFS